MRAVRLAVLWSLVTAPAMAQPPDPELPADQQRAATAIERLGGFVSRDSRVVGHPVTGVSFNDPITDGDLELVAAYPSLRYVTVGSGAITDVGLGRLAAIASLENLYIERSAITDAGWEQLAALPALRRLTIRDCPMSDAGLPGLAKCPRLWVVRFEDTGATDEGVARLKERMPYALISVVRKRQGERDDDRAADGLFWRVIVIVALFAGAGFGLARRVPAQRLRRVWKVPVVAAAILLMGVALLAAAPRAYPVRDGNAAEFWLYATRLDVGVADARLPWGGYYLPRDGWFIYYNQGFHGQFLRRVPAADADALFPKVADRLRKAPPGVLHPDVEAGFRTWEHSGAAPDDAARFLARLREARLTRLQRENPRLYQHVLPEEDEFNDRWRRIGRFRWNLWFEFVFLTGLILFAAWPWLRNAGRWRWAAHVALLPALFCLPYWLGYAPLTFTSAGDGEVVVYPRLLIALRGLPWSELDTAILRALPKPLEPLAQTSGPMLSLSGFGAPGPVAITVIGLVAGLMVIVGSEFLRRTRIRRLQPGN